MRRRSHSLLHRAVQLPGWHMIDELNEAEQRFRLAWLRFTDLQSQPVRLGRFIKVYVLISASAHAAREARDQAWTY